MAGVTDRKLTLVQASEADGGMLPSEQSGSGDVSGRGGRGTGASAAGQNPARGASRPNCGPWRWRGYAEERYADFGPTLMAEHLAREKGGGGSRDVAALAAGGR